jgi:cytochrome c-type biogenesis protein CcmH
VPLADPVVRPDPVSSGTAGSAHGEAPVRRALGLRRRLPRWLGPVSLGLVVTVALIVGSGVGGGGETVRQRAQAIEAQVRCPSCEDLSVLDSTASVAVAVRRQVAREVAAGWSDQQIIDQLVARYGPSIMLRPPTSGLTSLVWIVPAVGGAGAVVALAMVFRRRVRQMRALRSEDG